MALKYRIPYSSVPTWWRNRIAPLEEDGQKYYEVDQLCENSYGVIHPIGTLISATYKDENNSLPNYIYYNSALANFQETIPELKYKDYDFLALKGSGSTLYCDISDNKFTTGQLDISLETDENEPAISSLFKETYIRSNWGTTYTNFSEQSYTPDPAYQNVTAYSYKGGMIFQGSFFRSTGYSDLITHHRFDLWLSPDAKKLYIKDYNPPVLDDGLPEHRAERVEYLDTPKTYTMFFPHRRTGYDSDIFYTITVLMIGAGGAGHSGSVGHNGSGGGAGAFGVFQVDLREATQNNPVILKIGGQSTSYDEEGCDSHIYFTKNGVTEGFTVGAGKLGRSNSDISAGGYGGTVTSYNGNTTHNKIKLIVSKKGADGGYGIAASTVKLNGTSLLTKATTAPGTGCGGSSVAAVGAKHAETGGTYAGHNGNFPGSGGGGGSGPRQLGGVGGWGSDPWFGIIY